MHMPTYLSSTALLQFKKEWEDRKTTIRQEIAKRLQSAIAQGDLSENFEYQDAKDAQAENEQRIAQLEEIIQTAVVIDPTKSTSKQIDLGTRFEVDVRGVKKTFEIVGSQEANPLAGKISNESPLGQAFIGREVGEIVTISVPSGTLSYTISSIV